MLNIVCGGLWLYLGEFRDGVITHQVSGSFLNNDSKSSLKMRFMVFSHRPWLHKGKLSRNNGLNY